MSWLNQAVGFVILALGVVLLGSGGCGASAPDHLVFDASHLGCECNFTNPESINVPDAGPPPGGCDHCALPEECLSFDNEGYPPGGAVRRDAGGDGPFPVTGYCADPTAAVSWLTCPAGRRPVIVSGGLLCAIP
jgi:hypothetical protein